MIVNLTMTMGIMTDTMTDRETVRVDAFECDNNSVTFKNIKQFIEVINYND